MAGVLSRPQDIEEIREYFRKPWRRRNLGEGMIDTDSSCNKLSKCESLGIWTGKPKYREYSTVQSRRDSFKNWPHNKTQNIEELVEAGFAFLRVDDAVKCYYCSIELRDWHDGACPWKQHAFASPKCSHVIHCKGKSFIRQILGERDVGSESDIDDSEDIIDTVQLAIHRNEDAVKVARDYCLDENILKTAIKSLIKQDLNKKFSAVALVKTIQDIEDISESENSDGEEIDRPDLESVADMEETNRRLKEPVMCKICFNAIACIITLPCGHMVSCSQCISALTKCAVCRSQIKGTVRALMAV